MKSPLVERPLVDAHVRELPVAPVLELERQAHERLLRIGLEDDLLLFLVLIEGDVGDLLRIGEVHVHAVEHELDALVLVGGADEHRRHLQRDGHAADGGVQLLDARLLLGQELVGDGVVVVGDRRDHVVASGLDLLEAVGRDLFLADVLAVVAVEVEGLLLDEIDDPLEVGLLADRQLDGDGVVAQLLLELVGDARRVGARAIQLVDEREARDVVAAHLAVDGVRLRLHARGAAQHQHGAVEHAQRALDLDGEVDVPGGVDQVDDVAVPLAVGGRRLDRDPLLALEIHRVHLGADAGLAADLLDPVDLARVEKDALRQGRLARVDVRGDADVANFFEWDGGHGCLSSFGWKGAVV